MSARDNHEGFILGKYSLFCLYGQVNLFTLDSDRRSDGNTSREGQINEPSIPFRPQSFYVRIVLIA